MRKTLSFWEIWGLVLEIRVLDACMASGPIVGGDDEGREKRRFAANKVYTRKVFRGSKKDRNAVNTVAPATATAENDAPTATAATTATATNNILAAALPVEVPEDGNLSQSQVNSGEDGNLAQPRASSEEGGNLSQSQVNSGKDENLAQPQANSEGGGNLSQPQVHSGEGGNLAQSEVCSTENEDLAQLQAKSSLEDGSLAKPLVDSTLEDGNSAQPQVDSTLDGSSAQPQVNSTLEDGNSAQPQVDSTLDNGNLAQPPVNSALEDGNLAKPPVDSALEDGNLAQPPVKSTLEDDNSTQPQVDSIIEDGNSAQPQVDSILEDGDSAQPQVDSTLEDGNLAQPLVNSTLEDGSLAQPLRDSTLEDRNSAQPLVVLVSDDSCSHQRDEPSSLHVQRDDDGPSSPDHLQDAVPSRNLPSRNGVVEPQQDDDGPSSPTHQQDMIPCTRDLPLGNGLVEPRMEDRIKISLASKSKQEMQELRWKLESELDIVRSLVKRIEVKQGQVSGYGNSNLLVGYRIDNGNGAKRAHSEVASAGVPREYTRPLHQLSFSALENSQGISENVEKEKRTPKANQFYRNSEFLLAKDKFPPAESNKKSKLSRKKQGGVEMGHGLGMGSKFFKSCSSLLEKLMKHKHGWVFNAPVDVKALGLHDYFTIITHPMDLGTVKSRLYKNWYRSPKEFAEDVKLTFRNAMTYNPKGQDVHIMAEQLSKVFEDRWAIIESDYNREMRYGIDYGAAPPAPSPLSRKVPAFPPPPLDMRRILNRSESLAQTPRPTMSITPSSRTPAPKKPKAKDPHKRDMTFEEKQKLSTNLQSLPSEKLDAIVQIIKKRNSALSQHDDEIEVDIDSVDAETLWELDRFVTNYKKSLSKNKRKAEIAQARAQAVQNALQKAPVMVEVPKETQADERNVPPSMHVQGGNQADNGSRSSSSSSSSSDSGSSSSDSDSDSSSASGSDAGSQGA